MYHHRLIHPRWIDTCMILTLISSVVSPFLHSLFWFHSWERIYPCGANCSYSFRIEYVFFRKKKNNLLLLHQVMYLMNTVHIYIYPWNVFIFLYRCTPYLIRAAIVIKSDMSRMLAGSVVSTKRQPEFVPAMTNI